MPQYQVITNYQVLKSSNVYNNALTLSRKKKREKLMLFMVFCMAVNGLCCVGFGSYQGIKRVKICKLKPDQIDNVSKNLNSNSTHLLNGLHDPTRITYLVK